MSLTYPVFKAAVRTVAWILALAVVAWLYHLSRVPARVRERQRAEAKAHQRGRSRARDEDTVDLKDSEFGVQSAAATQANIQNVNPNVSVTVQDATPLQQEEIRRRESYRLTDPNHEANRR